ncbi:2-amino-4-hydroxy-6-hydroxymethyldihydropteridine pyrophosphokinase [Kocuria flava]|uniref:2-amino-4-hydroxy-6-hydroxymethyldihydropteridine diphosphokinase n=1 Tax=Kocuria flava TaxID=446860 RepID=A0A0U3G8J0_9MICC|nr:2-amino-4-hydroxy-6-hydroxymethyldihydropteridine diphosphokinase [Kocuria flava]ALU39387.1 2-amino-4-hydroxy-6-hydroxymethyldihydropteridine pyrophosphokinase [Kocuria flava]MCJ8503358.1 2-amino-4-hydroxy-6-hydroxymethyldihydropteridine diphosphokinase [Kocuria flava]GEO92608.1 2-amino-4-hydroxy-6-hydroxymethyldihydropteridine diphosphokinase [Kocuria flava]
MGVRAVLALGANLGDREGTLRRAALELAAHPGIRLVRASPVVATAPVGGPPGQDEFRNAVVEVETDLAPLELLRACQAVEDRHHRTREVRWGPRTLDVDVVDYDARRLDSPELTLPHPRAAGRAFVLVPWALMDPEAVLDGRPVAELARAAPDRDGVGPGTEPLLPADPPGPPGH